MEGQETRITATLGRNNEPKYQIEDKTPNPDKITFGRVSDGFNKLEFSSYGKLTGSTAFIFLNGERIIVDKFMARKLIGLTVKMGIYLGAQKKRKVKN